MDEDLKKLFEGVVGVVEANSFESLCLWQKYHKERGLSWEDSTGGPLVTIGRCDDRPVCISLFVNVIDGHRVLFMEPTSLVVDHQMIDNWLFQNLPITARKNDGKYLNKVDAMNFHNVLPRNES
jgi:hypothetical protein